MRKCILCKRDKDLTEFNKKKNRKDGLQVHCKECNRASSRKYYQANREKHIAQVAIRRSKVIKGNIDLILSYLQKHPCIDCNESDIVVLEFDHVFGEKRGNISEMVRGGCSSETIIFEMAKCEVRCANCHARKTAKDFSYYKYMRE